jgi:hypothetical protein
MSRGRAVCFGCGARAPVGMLPGDCPGQCGNRDAALEDLGLGLALVGAAGDIVLGFLMAVHANQRDAPQGAIGATVAAAVQAVAVGAAGRHRDRRRSTEPGEGPFGAQSPGVVSSSDEQLPGGINADARKRNQPRGNRRDQGRE